MPKNSAGQFGFFHPRVVFAFALCSFGACLAMFSFAASPPSGLAVSVKEPLSTKTLTAAAASWTIIGSPDAGAQYNLLNGVTCVSASDCWAAGYYAGAAFQTLIERWNGISWTVVPS